MSTAVKRFIQPRGTGLTYNICKYAIEHGCDIVCPRFHDIANCINALIEICEVNNKYKVINWSTAHCGYIAIQDVDDEWCTKIIKVYTPVSYYLLNDSEKQGQSLLIM